MQASTDNEHLLSALTYLAADQSVALVGPAGSGKSALLAELARRLPGDALAAWFDGTTLADLAPNALFGQFAAGLAQALMARGLPDAPALMVAMATPGRLSFEGAIRQLNQRGLRVALLIDQFEALSRNPQLGAALFGALRAAAARYRLAFVTASRAPLNELATTAGAAEALTSPFFNIFATLIVSPAVQPRTPAPHLAE